MLTVTAPAATTQSCAGGADETKTVIGHAPQVAGTANNLNPETVTSSLGTGGVTATTTLTYNNVGNRVTVDGPLTGAADTGRTRYDAESQMVSNRMSLAAARVKLH